MSMISTHVLDTVLGRPAAGIGVRLERQSGSEWLAVAASSTDEDGRCRPREFVAEQGVYRLTFVSGDYFKGQGRTTMYPEIAVVFYCSGEVHYHLPLLLSDNSYTTYRGS